MSGCWSEGEIRASLDRALPEAELEAVARHLEECPKCARLAGELEQRARRVSFLMDSLPDGMPEVVAVPEWQLTAIRAKASRRPAFPRWQWTGVPAAVAAAITLALLLAPSRTPQAPFHPHARVESPLSREASPPVEAAIQPEAPEAHSHPAVSQARPKVESRPQSAAGSEYYLALDDEPIDTGVVARVALSSGGLADVIFDSQGRPRAIRAVK